MATNNSTLSSYPQELEIPTAELWLEQGTIRVVESGDENTYYTDDFDREYYCKNYPQPVDIPAWIDQDLSPNQLAAILQSGCDSGAYLPAVEYHTSQMTMATHGDDVLDFLQECTGQLPEPPADVCWSGLAVHYLSKAVETWAACHAELANWNDESPLVERLRGDS